MKGDAHAAVVTYEAELFVGYMSGYGLPAKSFYDLPVDVAATLIRIQNEISGMEEDAASTDSVIRL